MANIVTIQSFSGQNWRTVDEVRLELTSRWLCIELYTMLVRRLWESEDARGALRETLAFLNSASDAQIAAAAPELTLQSGELLRGLAGYGRPRLSWQKLGDDFQWLLREQKDILRKGISVGWIAQRFEMPAFGLNSHELWHGRVGVGRNADYTSYDEMHLLSDMGYFLALTRKGLSRLDEVRSNHDKIQVDDEWYKVLTLTKSNVCATARQSVIASCAFVESFVNGIGLDHLERHLNLPEKQKQFLSGREKNRWVSLDRKLEGYPQVIQGKNSPMFCVVDRKQRQDPFKTFFEVAVDVRDGAMHAGKGKATIWLGAYEWKELAEKAVASAIEIGKLLWSNCKIGAPLPSEFWEFDLEKLLNHADERTDDAEKLSRILARDIGSASTSERPEPS